MSVSNCGRSGLTEHLEETIAVATRATFERHVGEAVISALKQEPLFKERLLPDIQSGAVFPAFRAEKLVDFYYGGRCLFSYERATGHAKHVFATHVKFASVLMGVKGSYVTEAQLANARHLTSFESGYSRIKKNCKLFSGPEAAGVAQLCKRSSCVSSKDDDVVVLDIEVALPGLRPRGKKSDRIDILLYDIPTCTLRFYEAKHFSNRELWARGVPEVVGQLCRYDQLLSDRGNRKAILGAYGEYVEDVNRLFGLKLPWPTTLDPQTVLLLFGFDRDQKARIARLLLDDGSLRGRRVALRGGTKTRSFTATSLWRSLRTPS